jgi:hypothetical protein
MKHVFAFALVALVGLAGVAQADWNRKGWVKLGEQTVNGRVDTDTIRVGRSEGSFTKLTIAVEASSLELLDFKVTFTNGQTFHPPMKHYFREGARTREIDLPGNSRLIQKIDVRYRNLPRGGNARLEVWGLRVAGGGRRR